MITVKCEDCQDGQWEVSVAGKLATLRTHWVCDLPIPAGTNVSFTYRGDKVCDLRIREVQVVDAEGEEEDAVAAATSLLRIRPFTGGLWGWPRELLLARGMRTTEAVRTWLARETRILALFRRRIQQNTTYVAVGEWAGPSAMVAAMGGVASRVLVFECDRYVVSDLFRNLLRNARVPTAVDSTCVADGDGPRRSKMRGDGGSGSAIVEAAERYRILGHPKFGGLTEFEVRLDSLPRLLAEHNLHLRGKEGLAADKVFLKIDAEGAEALILPQLLETLRELLGWCVELDTSASGGGANS